MDDADMLRRAAEACRNFTRQATGNTEWFTWVPRHLDRVADALDPPPIEPEPTELAEGEEQ